MTSSEETCFRCAFPVTEYPCLGFWGSASPWKIEFLHPTSAAHYYVLAKAKIVGAIRRVGGDKELRDEGSWPRDDAVTFAAPSMVQNRSGTNVVLDKSREKC